MMNKLTITLVALFLSFAAASTGEASMPKTAITAATGCPLALSGKGVKALPCNLQLGVAAIQPMDGWALFGEVGFATSPLLLQPNPRVLVGPVVPVTKKLKLGLVGLYELQPGYGEKELTHLIGAAVVPSYEIWKGISFAVPVAVVHPVGTSKVAFVPNLKLIVNL